MKTKMIISIVLILFALSGIGYGRAREIPLSQPVGTISGWPQGIDKLTNSPERVAGFSVNLNFELFYKGTTEQLNRFLRDCSKLEHTSLWVTTHLDSDRQSLLWPKKMTEDEYEGFDWKLTILKRNRFNGLFDTIPEGLDHIVAVDIWLDKGIEKELLLIPENVVNKSSLVEMYAKLASDKTSDREKEINDSRIINGNTEFAFNLYAQLKDQEGNLFFSPYSISTALAMTYAGAKGATAEQMAQTLHFSEYYPNPNTPTLRLEALLVTFSRNYGYLIEQFNQQGQKGDYQLSIANALWGQKGYPFLDSFIKLNNNYYHAGLENVDFVHETEKSRQIINQWVEDKTNDKIKNLIPQGALDAMTRLVLTNAIYFKGNWASQFDKGRTEDADFFVSSDKTVTVPLMYQKAKFNYAENDLLQILQLPYKGDDLSMVILLPKEKDRLTDIEKELSVENLAAWQKRIYRKEVLVYLPKFKMTSQFSLSETLAKMGMPDAFSDNADFSGMTGKKDLHISDVIHKAFVEVNEEGTEAAAATGIIMRVTSIPAPPPVFRADHPFIFLIKDNNTGSILFIGRVVDPTVKSE